VSLSPQAPQRTLVLCALCLGVLLVVLGTTIVTVALPSIAQDLQASAHSLPWILNAYTLTFSGFLLLSGRLGDLYGPRRLFLTGIAIFTLASLVCGFAHALPELLIARAVQGMGGALITAVSLALIVLLFPDSTDRARAMGAYAFVSVAGGGAGQLMGGILTRVLGWHWIFLVNVPIGALVVLVCSWLLPRDSRAHQLPKLDLAGALTVTAALTLLAYALTDARDRMQVETALVLAGALLLSFLVIEQRTREPLLPLRLLCQRNFATVCVVSALWAAGQFAWFVVAALYLQRVLHYDPLWVGVAFLPAQVLMTLFYVWISAKIVRRIGLTRPLWMGLLMVAAGIASFAHAPLHGGFVMNVLPGMVLQGIGAGMASTPLLLIAMREVSKEESGLASGVVNTAGMMGGALGLAVLSTIADARAAELVSSGASASVALNGGYHVAFLVAAMVTGASVLLSALGLRPVARTNGQSLAVGPSPSALPPPALEGRGSRPL
jgi:EmrB/QacA subfamily drug resistance transporter